MKKFARKKCREMFVEAIFFSHSRKRFSEFLYKSFVIALREIIGLQNLPLQDKTNLSYNTPTDAAPVSLEPYPLSKIVHCLSANIIIIQNYHV